jgi:hypothetical protein
MRPLRASAISPRPLPQFRFDVLQAERLIDPGFRLSGDDLVAALQAAITNRETLARGQRAKLLQMCLRAGR